MKRSLRNGAGYLQIDHRDSPGISVADVAHIPGAMAVAGGAVMETDVYQCSHCQRTIALHAPQARMKDRGYCPKCDHYVCNACEAARAKSGICVPMAQVVDAIGNQLVKGHVAVTLPAGSILLTDSF